MNPANPSPSFDHKEATRAQDLRIEHFLKEGFSPEAVLDLAAQLSDPLNGVLTIGHEKLLFRFQNTPEIRGKRELRDKPGNLSLNLLFDSQGSHAYGAM